MSFLNADDKAMISRDKSPFLHKTYIPVRDIDNVQVKYIACQMMD